MQKVRLSELQPGDAFLTCLTGKVGQVQKHVSDCYASGSTMRQRSPGMFVEVAKGSGDRAVEFRECWLHPDCVVYSYGRGSTGSACYSGVSGLAQTNHGPTEPRP